MTNDSELATSGEAESSPPHQEQGDRRGARTTVLLAAAVALTGCAAFWSRAGDLTPRVASHLLVFGVAFFAYVAALASSRGLRGRGLAAALLLAVAWRAALLLSPPLLSEDVYRYLWEGHVQSHGGNPYAPEDRATTEKWEPLRDELWRLMANKRFTAIYPPLWQLAARAVTTVHHSVLAMKVFVVTCELACWAVLWALLRRRRLPPSRLLVFAWSPLALVEVAGSGHNDTFGLLLLCLALLALDGGRTGLSAAAAALGAAAKVLPGVVAVAWIRRYRPRDLALAAALAALTAVPYLSAGSGLWQGATDYGSWRFNESLLALLDTWAPSRLAAQRVAGLLVVGLALWLGVKRAEPVLAGLFVIAAWIALSAHVLPWYALWFLPWLTLRDAPPALLFTWTATFAYMVYPEVQSGAGWQVPWSMRALEYLPPLALLAWTGWKARTSQAPRAPSAPGSLAEQPGEPR